MKTTIHFVSPTRRAKTALLLLSLTGLLAVAQTPQVASLSELLEQGVYSEETTGDLDAALKAYQRVVADAKAGEALAAQAQYRLGVVLYKQKNFAEATAAFEKLVKDYPDQKELVKRANDYLAGAAMLLPPPWADGEAAFLDVKLGSGFKIGVARYTFDSGERDGRKTWRLSSYLHAGVHQLSYAEVEADSFKPIHCRWKHTLLGDSETTYSPGKAVVKMKGTDEPKTTEVDGVIYDNEEYLALLRRLPLATNYSHSTRVFSGLSGGHLVPLKMEVTAVETVKVPAGTFECFKCELNIKQTFWISADDRRSLVKFEAGGVTAELTEVRQRDPNAPVAYKDSLFSVTAPAGWLFFAQKTIENDKRARLVVLDPDGMADTVLTTRRLDDFKPEERASLRAMADRAIAEGTKMMKEFKVRADSWTETSLAGRPALSVLGDFIDGQEAKVAYAVFAVVGDNAVELHTHVAAKDFESFRPKFDAIVKTVKLN